MSVPDVLYGEIHRRFGFALPDEYRRMQERGWFEPTSNDYLWLYEMKWITLKDICGGDPVFFPFAKPGLIPFAITAGRDHWCWYPEHATDGIAPVVECPRDSMFGRFYAPSFLGAIYRRILDFACDRIAAEDENRSRQLLKRWSDDLGPLLPANWRATMTDLQSVSLRAIQRPEGEAWGLLAPDDRDLLVQRDLAFPKLDEEFQWMVE